MNERDPRTFAIIGAAMAVHRELGYGFLESVYQEALACELADRGITFQQEVALPVRYKSRILNAQFRADFICFGDVIVELKALSVLCGVEESKILNYLTATGLEIGLLLNFGTASLVHKRFIGHASWRKSPSV